MTDKRTRAWKIAKEIYDDSAQPADIEQALLAFAAEEVAAERARCAKVCRLKAVEPKTDTLTAIKCAEAIERGEAIRARDEK